MKRTRDLQQTGLEEIYYNKLTDLEVRVPGLKQTMNELRTSYNEKIRPSNLRSKLGVTSQSYIDELDLTTIASASVTGKMREVEEGITRCRDLLNQHKELTIKVQKREETEFRLNEVGYDTYFFLASYFFIVTTTLTFVFTLRWNSTEPILM